MEPEQKRSFEDVVNRNVSSGIQHGNQTRQMLREIEEHVERLENRVQTLTELMENLTRQLSLVQGKLYAGGTSGD
jgi:chaperonin cofactor prefoldin